MSKQITIDGFNGTGKTTLARSLAQKLDYTHISTGIIFRSLSYCMLKNKVDIKDIEKISQTFENMRLILPDNRCKSVIINGSDITNKIMDMEYAIFASKISNNELLQSMVRDFIRQYAKDKNIVIDGRDTGRLLFPNAKLKFALIADTKTRAERRMKQNNKSKNTLDEVINQINEIDRKLIEANCIPPTDAIIIDTTSLKPEEVLEKVLRICRERENARRIIEEEFMR